MGNSKHVDLAKIETSGIDNFNERVFSLNKKSNVFEIKNWQFLGQTKQRFFLFEDKLYKEKKRVIFDNYRKLLIPQYHSILQ